MIWKFFIPLICFLGYFFGIVLAKISPEEMAPGKKYFKAFKIILILLLGALSAYYGKYLLFIILGLVLGYFIPALYFYLGLLLVAAFLSSSELLVMFSSLIFIFGLPSGSLDASKKNGLAEKFVLNLILFSLPLLLLLIDTNASFLYSLSSGLLLGRFIRMCASREV
ncbi:hypothetical protein D6777_02895 [Candidatus Woesearchaeota archaeon]|nr:MAG: hypothetical protein D6777_02895 [Candidatus Woesearchaeota archaeon]